MLSPDMFECTISGRFLAQLHSGSFSPWWQLVHTCSFTVLCGLANASCMVPMPWQLSHCTFPSLGESDCCWNPPGLRYPTTWQVMHSGVASFFASTSVCQATACAVVFHCSPSSW